LFLFLKYAGYQTDKSFYFGSQARIGAWGVPYMNPNSSYEVSITVVNGDGDSVSMVKAGLHVCKINIMC
jgi:hypothetical protein